jgi:hypothetical protein
MVTRTSAGNAKVLKEQYELLKDAVNGYFAGTEIKAIVAAVHIRTLVHDTDRSDAFLATIDPNFKKLDIYRKRQPSSKAVFWMPVGVQMSGDGISRIIRDDFKQGVHELVPLERWWIDPYLVIGEVRSSKKQVVIDVANKDGGAHVDDNVPSRHVAATLPPLLFGVNENFIRPDFARGTVAQAGGELPDYLERHFSAYIV